MNFKLSRRKMTSVITCTASGLWTGLPAWAQQAYPQRSVKLVVGATPGGPSDFMGRMFADSVGPALGQAFVIENKPGASGMPAADQVAKSLPDGYNLLVSGPASMSVMPHLFSKITYDAMRDFTPVAMLGAGAFVLVVHPSVKAQNLRELIALSKANPEELNYGSGGLGSSGHLCTEYFSGLVGAKLKHVPYKGDGQAVVDLISGTIQVMFTAPNVAMAHVKSGKLRLLAVTTKERVASMPDVATVNEAGVKDFEYLGWIIVFAPNGTPLPVIDQLATAWQKSKGNPNINQKLNDLGMAAPERFSSRPALIEFVKNEYARLGKLIRDNNIRTEA
jgi:tripartite-type tricarboxylate transporter receptor subunit TctC